MSTIITIIPVSSGHSGWRTINGTLTGSGSDPVYLVCVSDGDDLLNRDRNYVCMKNWANEQVKLMIEFKYISCGMTIDL